MPPGVEITLQKPDGSVVKTAATDSNGLYVFTDVEPGTYVIKETNLLMYPLDCVLSEMIAIALDLGRNRIGVYMRVDMFVVSTMQFYVQEYKINGRLNPNLR